MRHSRPVREHDPEWPWSARTLIAFWKVCVLVAVGVTYGMAALFGGVWLALVGAILLLGVGCVLRQEWQRRRENSRPSA